MLSAVSGRRCLPICMDVRQPETIAAAVDETLKEFGRIDILINSTRLCSKIALFEPRVAEFALRAVLNAVVAGTLCILIRSKPSLKWIGANVALK